MPGVSCGAAQSFWAPPLLSTAYADDAAGCLLACTCVGLSYYLIASRKPVDLVARYSRHITPLLHFRFRDACFQAVVMAAPHPFRVCYPMTGAPGGALWTRVRNSQQSS